MKFFDFEDANISLDHIAIKKHIDLIASNISDINNIDVDVVKTNNWIKYSPAFNENEIIENNILQQLLSHKQQKIFMFFYYHHCQEIAGLLFTILRCNYPGKKFEIVWDAMCYGGHAYVIEKNNIYDILDTFVETKKNRNKDRTFCNIVDFNINWYIGKNRIKHGLLVAKDDDLNKLIEIHGLTPKSKYDGKFPSIIQNCHKYIFYDVASLNWNYPEVHKHIEYLKIKYHVDFSRDDISKLRKSKYSIGLLHIILKCNFPENHFRIVSDQCKFWPIIVCRELPNTIFSFCDQHDTTGHFLFGPFSHFFESPENWYENMWSK